MTARATGTRQPGKGHRFEQRAVTFGGPPFSRLRFIHAVGVGNDKRDQLIGVLAQGGCIAPEEEADALLQASAERVGAIDELLSRRLSGEPLAWITGSVLFCGQRIKIDPGVFVPRPHTQLLAERALSLLPEAGVAVDLCTGSGAIAAVLNRARPRATVLATDIDPVAVGCAQQNGVDALLGNLDEPLPDPLRGRVNVMTAVVPYVPEDEFHLLPRGVVRHEPRRALDGGRRGTSVLILAAQAAASWLGPDGVVLLELGGDQATDLEPTLAELGLSDSCVHRDDDGQDRAIEARRPRAG